MSFSKGRKVKIKTNGQEIGSLKEIKVVEKEPAEIKLNGEEVKVGMYKIDDIIKVQPMTVPSSLIFHMDFPYEYRKKLNLGWTTKLKLSKIKE